MEELREMLRTIIREELSAKGKSPKAEFAVFGTFATGDRTQLRISVAETDKGVSLGMAKVHGDFVEKTFGFRLTEEVAGALVQLATRYYPNLVAGARKKGRGA
jgi:hypothetical protein